MSSASSSPEFVPDGIVVNSTSFAWNPDLCPPKLVSRGHDGSRMPSSIQLQIQKKKKMELQVRE